MIAILVIFLGRREAEWEHPPLSNYLKTRMLELTSISELKSTWVLTDSAVVEHAAREAGLSDVSREQDLGAEDFQELAALISNRIGRDSPMALVFCQTPGASAFRLKESMQEYAAEPSCPLISIASPEDHPYQLQNLSEVVAGGMLHLFDTEPDLPLEVMANLPPGCAISKSFPFDWKLLGEGTDSGGFFFSQIKERLVPILPKDITSNSLIWLRQNADSARIVWLEEPRWPQACGLASSAISGINIFLSNKDGVLHIHGSVTNDYRIQLVPFASQGEMDVSPGEGKLIDITINEDAPILKYDDRIAGFAYVLLRHPDEGQYALNNFFSPNPGQYLEWDQAVKDGARLPGRQAFPPVWRIVPGIFIGTATQLGEVHSLLAESRVRGVRLNYGAFLVEDEVDYFRHIAEIRAEEMSGGGHS